MATIVEKDSDSGVNAVLIFVLFTLLVIGAVWFAYANGMFAGNGNTPVIENNKTLVMPAQPAQPAQPSEPSQPAQPEPAH